MTKKYYLLNIILILSLNVVAQQVYIQAPVIPASGCTTISDLYSVSISNFQTENVACAMTISIRYSGNSLTNGTVADGGLTGAPVFNLPVGMTQLSTSNINTFFPVRNINFFDSSLESLNDDTACLPPGSYEVCLQLFGVNVTGQIDPQNRISQTCYTITKSNTNNIFLIAPYNQENVNSNLPIFTWSPIANFNSTSNYAIEIVEVLEGQTAFEALRSNPIFYSQNGLKTNTFQYPVAARQLEQCRNYAWRVGYYQDRNFNNSSFTQEQQYELESELWTFSYSCGNENTDTYSKITAHSLVSPVNREVLTVSRDKVFFSWTELTPPQDGPVTYILRVVEKPLVHTSLYAFNNNTPVLSQPVIDNNYYTWAGVFDYLDKNKEYVWGVIPYNSDQEQLVEGFYLEKHTFTFSEDSVPDELPIDCPLEMGPTNIISQNYNESKNEWIIELSRPSDNSEELSKQEYEYELLGKIISVTPEISGFSASCSNDKFDIAIINISTSKIQLSLTPSLNNKFYNSIGHQDDIDENIKFSEIPKTFITCNGLSHENIWQSKLSTMQSNSTTIPGKTHEILWGGKDISSHSEDNVNGNSHENVWESKLRVAQSDDNSQNRTTHENVWESKLSTAPNGKDVHYHICNGAGHKSIWKSLLSMAAKSSVTDVDKSDHNLSSGTTHENIWESKLITSPGSESEIHVVICNGLAHENIWESKLRTFGSSSPDIIKLKRVANKNFVKSKLRTPDRRSTELRANNSHENVWESKLIINPSGEQEIINIICNCKECGSKSNDVYLAKRGRDDNDNPKVSGKINRTDRVNGAGIEICLSKTYESPDGSCTKSSCFKSNISFDNEDNNDCKSEIKGVNLIADNYNAKENKITIEYNLDVESDRSESLESSQVEITATNPADVLSYEKQPKILPNGNRQIEIFIDPTSKNTDFQFDLCFYEYYKKRKLECVTNKYCLNRQRFYKPQQLPKLTKFEVIKDFPLLEPDKSILVKLDIEDNDLSFPAYDIEYGDVTFESTDESVTLEVLESDDLNHTYKLLPKDPATLDTVDITNVDLDITALNINTSFNYKILKSDDPGNLPILELDTSFIMPMIPLDALCELQITRFQPKTLTYEYISGDLINTDGDTIQDAFLIDFSIDTREQPNRNDLYQRNHRIDFTLNSSSIPIVIDTIIKEGRVQKYAIVPDWGNTPANERTIDAISFDIDACLSIDFNDLDGNTDCTQINCVDIINQVETIAPCPIAIPKFEVYSLEYIPGSMNSMDHPDTEVSEFYYYQFDFGLDNVQLPDGYTMDTHVMFSNKNSNIPINYYNLGQDYAWAITPMYDMLDYDMDEQEVFFTVEACVTSEIYNESGLLQCLDSECLTLNKIKNRGINEIEVEDPCGIESLIFEVSEGYPMVSNENSSIVDPDGDALSGDYFIYDFDIKLGSDQNSVVEILRTELETVSSNIPLYFSKTQEDKFAIVPFWNLSDEFGVSEQEEVWFDVIACLEYSVLNAYSTDTLCYVEKDTCINLVQLSESIEEDNDPNLTSEVNCQFQVDFTYETIGDDVILKPTALPFDSDIDYVVSWKFEDGTPMQLDNPLNGILISARSDQNEENDSKYTVAFNEVAGQELTLEVSIDGNPCLSTFTKRIRNIPDCDATQCDFVADINPNNLTTDDVIELCGDLFINISSLTDSSPSNLSGFGTVYIPWLLTNVEVEFQGIKVNSSLQFVDGKVNAAVDNISGTNINGFVNDFDRVFTRDEVINVNKYLTDGSSDKIIRLKQEVEDLIGTNSLKLPLGFNNMAVGDNGTALTIAITALRFEPQQNYIKTTAAVEFFDSNDDNNSEFYLCFDSDNFFFNASKPIFNTGNTLDFKFNLIDDVSFNYLDGESLQITFKAADDNDLGGTGIEFVSECNEPYNWVVKVDAEIEIPDTWLKPPADSENDRVVASLYGEVRESFSDFLITGDLSPAIIPGTNETELEFAEVTWDHSNIANPDGITFPIGYENPPVDNTFKGLYIKEVSAKLPKELSTFDSDDRITASLTNLIVEPGNGGLTVDAIVSPILTIPEMNVADLGASLDEFKLSIINGKFEEAYLKGEITLPVADYDESDPVKEDNKVEYTALFGNVDTSNSGNEFEFSLSPKNGIEADLIARANLQILETSKFRVLIDNEDVSFDFVMHGLLDFPDAKIEDPILDRDWGFSLDAGFENLTVGYTKPFGEDGSMTFDKGNWTFDGIPDFANNFTSNSSSSNQNQSNVDLSSFDDNEEEGNGVEGFKFTIENFDTASETPEGNELLVGGIGFDAVVNLKDKVGGAVGIALLGKVYKPTDSRLRVGFKEFKIDSIGVFANLSGAKLDGYVNFINEEPYGRAVQGGVNAIFKGADVTVSADLLFGRTLDSHPQGSFRYMKAEALATFPDPGVPLAPGFVFRGFGVGFYSNMNADFPDLEQLSNTKYSSAFSGVTFTPDTLTSWGLGLFAMAATSPKEKTFNMDLSLKAQFSSSGGISNINLDAKVFGGTNIDERYTSDPWLTGFLIGNLHFPNKLFSLNAGVNISLDPFISTPSPMGVHMYLDGLNDKFHFSFGQPNTTGANTVTFMDGINAKMYLMFGNEGVDKATGWIGPETARMMRDFAKEDDFSADDPNDGNFEDIVHTGKGFSTGLSVEGVSQGSRFGIDYDIGAGGEFHLSMLDYGQEVFCGDHSPIGFNGYYMNASLGVWARAGIGVGGDPLVSIAAGGSLHAEFPRPWKLSGNVFGDISLDGSQDSLNLSFNYDFSIGEDCEIEQVTNPENYVIHNIENVTDDLFIFRDVFVEDGAQNFDPEKPLRWTTYYNDGYCEDGSFNDCDGEIFYLPQMQPDGTVKSRKLTVKWKAQLFEEVYEDKPCDDQGVMNITQWKEIKTTSLDTLINENGHWCLYKDVTKFGEPIMVATTDGLDIVEIREWTRDNYQGDVFIQRFNDDEREDVMFICEDEQKIYLSKNDKFYHTDPPQNFPSLSDSEIATIRFGDFNSDRATDFYYQTSLAGYVVYNLGLQGNAIKFSDPVVVIPEDFFEIVLSNQIPVVGDFNKSGLDDIYLYYSGHLNLANLRVDQGSLPSKITSYLIENNSGNIGFSEPQIMKSWEWSVGNDPATMIYLGPFGDNFYAFDFDNDGYDDFIQSYSPLHNQDWPSFKNAYKTLSYGEPFFQRYLENFDFAFLYGRFVSSDQFDYVNYNPMLFDNSDLNLTPEERLLNYINESITGLGIPIMQLVDDELLNRYQDDATEIHTGFFKDGNADFLLRNVNNPFQYELPEGGINLLTPNTKHKLVLTGNITKGHNSYIRADEEIIIEFTTGDSPSVQELVDQFNKDESYFDPTYSPPNNTITVNTQGNPTLGGILTSVPDVAIAAPIKGDIKPTISTGLPNKGEVTPKPTIPYHNSPLILVKSKFLNPVKLLKR